MSKPTLYNIDIYQGDDYSWGFEFTANDVPIDITGWSIYLTAKRNITDPDSSAVIQKIVTSHTDPVNGKSAMNLTHTETDAFPEGILIYDIQIKTLAGEIHTIYKGQMKVSADVTLAY
jgi:hypothetical protein